MPADIATRLVAASIEGWVMCRDNPEECRDLVVAAGSQLGNSHQLWQMNEINKLIWPSPDGIGITNEDAWNRTVDIAINTPNLEGATVLTAEPSEGAYTNDIVTAAHALLPADLDITGESFEPIAQEEVLPEAGGA
jgi:NitT/TauT family transport system substrate-binding protein